MSQSWSDQSDDGMRPGVVLLGLLQLVFLLVMLFRGHVALFFKLLNCLVEWCLMQCLHVCCALKKGIAQLYCSVALLVAEMRCASCIGNSEAGRELCVE